MRSLENAGLNLNRTKRASDSILTPPMPPDTPRPTRNMALGGNSPPSHQNHVTPITPVSSTFSSHAFVSPASLGPPSPTSSPSSSPPISHTILSEFSQAFPSIDELDELKVPQQPPNYHHVGGSSPPVVKPFPVLPIDPGPRPSSTPIVPTLNSFISRPGSPAMTHTVLLKPSGLGLGSSPASPTTSNSSKPELPVTNVVLPKALHEYTRQNLKVLFLDVRHRADFDIEHIKADAVVCLEPSVLTRDQ
jgi:ubiquitin carboxyl-terminal hydrolase 8